MKHVSDIAMGGSWLFGGQPLSSLDLLLCSFFAFSAFFTANDAVILHKAQFFPILLCALGGVHRWTCDMIQAMSSRTFSSLSHSELVYTRMETWQMQIQFNSPRIFQSTCDVHMEKSTDFKFTVWCPYQNIEFFFYHPEIYLLCFLVIPF